MIGKRFILLRDTEMEFMDIETLGKNLKSRRQHLGLTQKDLERKSGVSQGKISELEKAKEDRSNPTLEIVSDLAVALKVPVYELLFPEFRPDMTVHIGDYAAGFFKLTESNQAKVITYIDDLLKSQGVEGKQQ